MNLHICYTFTDNARMENTLVFKCCLLKAIYAKGRCGSNITDQIRIWAYLEGFGHIWTAMSSHPHPLVYKPNTSSGELSSVA